MKYGIMDYEVIGDGTPVLIMEMLSKIILLVPCIIPGEKQGRVEPLTVINIHQCKSYR